MGSVQSVEAQKLGKILAKLKTDSEAHPAPVVADGEITESKRSEEAVRRAEEELRDFVENASVAMHWVGPDGMILWANRTELETLGYTKNEYIGHHIAEFHADEPVIQDILCRLTNRETLSEYEARLRCKDGSIRHVVINSNVLWEDDKFIHTRCFTLDITERKKVEAALRKSENLKSAILDVSLDAIITMDHEGNVADFNPTAEKIFGHRREDILGKPLAELIIPERLRARHYAGMARYLETGDGPMLGQRIELPALHVDGHEFPVELSISPIAGMTPPMFTSTLRDITERKQTEQALRESAERFRFMAESMPQKIFTAKPNGDVDYFNQQWMEFTGLTFDQIRDWGWTQFIHPDDVNENIRLWKHSVETGEPFQFEHRFRRHDGVYRWHLSRASAMSDADGKVRMWTGSNTDIDDQKQAKEKLEATVVERTAKLQETVSELESFSYSISHDMRAPLRAMQSFAQILEEDYRGEVGDRGREYIRRIVTAADRMDRLIQDVLTYSRVAPTEIPLENVDLPALINGILEGYPQFQSPKAEITVAFPLPRVRGNVAALTQCLSNLVGNAVKFVPPGVVPRVKISATARDKRVRLSIQDNGIGIDPKMHEKIFGIFYRLSQDYDGTGIGLAVVRRAADRMGATIAVESEPGRGSTFHLELAAAPWE